MAPPTSGVGVEQRHGLGHDAPGIEEGEQRDELAVEVRIGLREEWIELRGDGRADLRRGLAETGEAERVSAEEGEALAVIEFLEVEPVERGEHALLQCGIFRQRRQHGAGRDARLFLRLGERSLSRPGAAARAGKRDERLQSSLRIPLGERALRHDAEGWRSMATRAANRTKRSLSPRCGHALSTASGPVPWSCSFSSSRRSLASGVGGSGAAGAVLSLPV